MRIVVIGSFAPSLLIFRRQLLEAMVSMRHNVVAVAPDISPEIQDGLSRIGVESRGVSLERTGFNPLADLHFLAALFRLLRSERPDIVFSYTIKPVIYGSLAASSVGVPRIFSMVTGLGYAFLGETWKQRLAGTLAQPLYRAALRRNERVFFQNPDDLRHFCDLGLLGEREQAVLINGSGVDLARFAPAPPVVNTVSFLLIARLYREKGIYEFVEAARQVKQRHSAARFRIVGAIDSNPSALRPIELEAWQRQGLIEYTGWVDDVRPQLAGASVYVLPSYREGTPRTVLEAMAMARPVITTDAPGCRETVVLGENGFLVPVKDVKALAEAMERFILQPELIAKMGRRSRQIATEKFDVHKVNEVILKTMGLSVEVKSA